MIPRSPAFTGLPVLLCGLLGCAAVLSACGAGGPAAAEPGATKPGARKANPPAEAAGRCHDRLRGFLGSLGALRNGLAVGFTYETYYRRVREIRQAYAKIPADRLGAGCLIAAAAPAERALDEYIDAANAWGDCAAEASCSAESIEPELQRRWRLAAGFLSTAEAALRGMPAG